MKPIFLFALTFITPAQFALADHPQGEEAPIRRAKLAYLAPESMPFPHLKTLTLMQGRGSEMPTSFETVEDSGLRYTGPGSTSRALPIQKVKYTIINMSPGTHNPNGTNYVAVEVLRSCGSTHRKSPRTLFVSEYEKIAPRGNDLVTWTVWDVEVKRDSQPTQYYYGNPKDLEHLADEN